MADFWKKENIDVRARAERGEAGAQLALAWLLYEKRDCECWHWFVAASFMGDETAKSELQRLLLIPAQEEGRNVSLLSEKVSLLEEHVRLYGFLPPQNRDFLNSLDPGLAKENPSFLGKLSARLHLWRKGK